MFKISKPLGGLREDLQYKKSPWNLYSLKYQLVIIWLEILQGYYYGEINTKYKSAVQYSTKKQVRFKKLILNNIVHTSWIVGSGNWVTVCWEIKFFHYAIIRKKKQCSTRLVLGWNGYTSTCCWELISFSGLDSSTVMLRLFRTWSSLLLWLDSEKVIKLQQLYSGTSLCRHLGITDSFLCPWGEAREIQGAQHSISIKNLRFLYRLPRAKVRCQGALGAARTQPYY